MKKSTTNNQFGQVGVIQNALDAVGHAIQANITNDSLAGSLDVESISDDIESEALLAFDGIKGELAGNAGFTALLAGNDTESLLDVASDAAVYIPGSAGIAEYQASVLTKAPIASDVTSVGDDGLDYLNLETESFAESEHFDSRVVSVVMNTIAAKQSRLGETWFPTKVITAKENGLMIPVRLPKIVMPKPRSSAATKYTIESKTLIQASIDSSVFDNISTTIVPVAEAGADDKLVTAAVYPNINKMVDNTPVKTRPIKTGVEVDLLAISKHSGMIGEMTEEDTIHSIVGIKSLVFSVVIADGTNPDITTTIELPFETAQGAIFQRTNTGSSNDYFTKTKAVLNLTDKLITPLNNGTDAVAALRTAMDLGPESPFFVNLEASVSGNANLEFANGVVETSTASVAGKTADFVSGAGVTATLVGWFPNATRTNDNDRTSGIIVDSGSEIKYLLHANFGTPFIAKAPTNKGDLASRVSDLADTFRAYNRTQAVNTILNEVDAIEAGHDRTEAATGIALNYLTNAHVQRDTHDFASDAIAIDSANAQAAMRGALCSRIANNINELLAKVGYLNAMEVLHGNSTQWEIVMTCNTRYAPLLMESGDGRLFGEGRNVVICPDDNIKLKDLIVFSFRTKTKDLSPLDSGVHVVCPSVTRQAAGGVRDNGSTSARLYYIPRSTHHQLLPAIGVISLENGDVAFTGK